MLIRKNRQPPVWKTKHELRAKAVNNTRLNAESARMLKNWRSSVAAFSVGLVAWFYVLSGITPAFIREYYDSWAGPLIVLFIGFCYGLHSLIMYIPVSGWKVSEWTGFKDIKEKCFDAPDWSKYLRSNERIPIDLFPDPQAGKFALATAGKHFLWKDFTGETNAGHWIVISKPQKYGRDNLANVILHNLLADASRPDVLAMILDSQGGVQFSPWLRYDYSELTKSQQALKSLRANVRAAELRDLEQMPRVAFFDRDSSIIGALKWLEAEVKTRLDEGIDVYGVKRAPIVVLLDEDVSSAFLENKGKFREATDSIAQIVFNGKPAGVNLVLFAPPELDWSKFKKDWKEWFDSVEFPHLTEFGNTEEGKGGSKNASIPSFVDVIRLWIPNPILGKAPYVEPEWSAKLIDKVGDKASDATLSLWQAMQDIRPWEPRKLVPREQRPEPIINNLPEPKQLKRAA